MRSSTRWSRRSASSGRLRSSTACSSAYPPEHAARLLALVRGGDVLLELRVAGLYGGDRLLLAALDGLAARRGVGGPALEVGGARAQLVGRPLQLVRLALRLRHRRAQGLDLGVAFPDAG